MIDFRHPLAVLPIEPRIGLRLSDLDVNELMMPGEGADLSLCRRRPLDSPPSFLKEMLQYFSIFNPAIEIIPHVRSLGSKGQETLGIFAVISDLDFVSSAAMME
uniref:hypothetical protein n=1 Tax=Castellaniella defragrans TaxID=75697 RepID=UPI00333F1C5A